MGSEGRVNPQKRILIICLSVLATIAIVAGFLYWRGWQSKQPARIIDIRLAEGPFHIGAPIYVRVDTELPWAREVIGETQLLLPEGLKKIDEQRQDSLGFGVRRTRIILQLLAHEYGPFEDAAVRVSVEADRDGGNDEISGDIPNITITPRDLENNQLAMAAEMPKEFLRGIDGQPWWVWTTICILVVVGLTVLLTVLLKPKRHERAPPPAKPWVLAESAIHRLRGRLPLPADEVFVELTDIIRRYIEAVYTIRATESTTPEFLREINREGSELFTEHRLLLTDFLTAADMVKFARLESSQSQIEDTMKLAMKFIVETSDSLRRQAEVERQFASLGGKT